MDENQHTVSRSRVLLGILLLILALYLSRQAIRLKEAEDAHHEAADEYFRRLEEEKGLPQ